MRQMYIRAGLALATMMLLTGCSDTRLDKLALGLSKDSVSALMGDPPHRTVSMLTGGKNWDVQLYSRGAVTDADSVPWRKMSPVVFIDQKAVGWGWRWWGDAAAKQGIAMPK